VVFDIYASVRPMRAVQAYKPFIRIDGRMISVRSGRDLGSYEFGSDIDFKPLSEFCVKGEPPNECLFESFGDQAREIGVAVGSALATKLAGFLASDYPPVGPGIPLGPGGPVGPGVPLGPGGPEVPVITAVPPPGDRICDGMDGASYKLLIRDFNGPELNRLEEAFTSFACYQGHRVMRSQPGITEYWYETRADQARLTRNLRFTLEYMNLPGNVSVTEGGSKIVVEKLLMAPHGVITVPPGTRY
jgi:hypothetical protein